MFAGEPINTTERRACNHMVAYYAARWMQCSKRWLMRAVESCSMQLYKNNGQTLGELVRAPRHDAAGGDQASRRYWKRRTSSPSVWRGREKLHYLNPVPMHEICRALDWQIRTPSPSGVE